MPSLSCPCGEVISLSELPNEHEFPLFSDEQFEKLQDALVAGVAGELSELQRQRQISIIFSARSPKPQFVECPVCGRLALFHNMSDLRPAVWYIPEVGPSSTGPRIHSIFKPGNTSECKE